MRKVTGAGSPVRALTVSSAAHHYYLCGIEFTTTDADVTTTLLDVGTAENGVNNLPSYIIFDRCYVHAYSSTRALRRGIALGGTYCAVINSNISDCKEVGADSQAIGVWNTPGPLLIENCYLEAAGENFMSGGTTGPNAVIPSDMTMRKCHLKKPLSWLGSAWSVKNLFELKIGDRVLVEQCAMENAWVAGQNTAVNIKVNGDSGSWATTGNLTFRYNKVFNVDNAVKFIGAEEGPVAEPLHKVSFRHNLMVVTGLNGGACWIFQFFGGSSGHSILHNTGVITIPIDGRTAYLESDSQPDIIDDITIKDNLTHRQWRGAGTSEGTPTFDASFVTYTMTNNAVIEGAGSYPSGNFLPANTGAVGFVNFAGGDYSLTPGGTYAAGGASDATDGTDLGADVAAVESYAAAAIAG